MTEPTRTTAPIATLNNGLNANNRCDACHVAAAQVAVLDPETGQEWEMCGHHFDQHADALYEYHGGSLLVDDYRDRLVEPGGLRTGVSA